MPNSDSPFYVIMYAKDAEKDETHSNNPSFLQTLIEIEEIRSRFDHAEINGKTSPDTILPEIPFDRSIFVCGFFRDLYVSEQAETLRNHGYTAQVSPRGVFSLS